MVVIYCCLKRENYKVLNFHRNKLSYFKTLPSFKYSPQISAAP